MRLNLVVIITSAIFVLAVISRLVGLFSFPPSLNWDEVSLGYNAYSLGKSGHDEWGVAFPTILRAYGDYKLPGYVYSLVPLVLGFGLNALSVRSVSVFSGLLCTVSIYILARKIFPQQKQVAIVSALALLLVPWSWFLSRIALEANYGLLLVVLGITSLVYRRYVSASMMLGLSVWTYNANRIFVPLVLICCVILYRRRLKPRVIPLVILLSFLLPMFWQLVMPTGLARFRWTTLLDEGAIAQINESRALPGGRLVYNKFTFLVKNISLNYLKHFSPNYLFVTGGTQYQFSIPQTGLLYLIQMPLFYIGLLYLLLTKKNTSHKLILFWLLLSPLPSSITRDAPHVLRSISMLPPIILTASLGLWFLGKKIKKLYAIYGLLLVISFLIYLKHIPTYQSQYAWSWQYGHEQVVRIVKEKYDSVDEILITKKYGEPHEFILFFWPWDPSQYRQDPNLIRYGRSDWFWTDGFGKFKFINDWEMSSYVANLPAGKRYLIVTSPSAPTIGSTYAVIDFPDGQTAFKINIL